MKSMGELVAMVEQGAYPQSPRLTEFYRACNDWIMRGCKESDPVFSRRKALCSSLQDYLLFKGTPEEEIGEVKLEMTMQFDRAGLHCVFPFDNGDWDHFNRQKNIEYTWLNLKRLAWVEEHAK